MAQPGLDIDVGAPAALKLQAPHRTAIPNEVSEISLDCPFFASDLIRSTVSSAVIVMLTDYKKSLHGRDGKIQHP